MRSRWPRGVAYLVVLVGFVIWIISGGWQNPAQQSDGGRVPMITLAVAAGVYLVGTWLEDGWNDRQFRLWLKRNRWQDLDRPE
jgi:hypothetical protein